MKNKSILILAFAFIFILASCGQTKDIIEKKESELKETETEENLLKKKKSKVIATVDGTEIYSDRLEKAFKIYERDFHAMNGEGVLDQKYQNTTLREIAKKKLFDNIIASTVFEKYFVKKNMAIDSNFIQEKYDEYYKRFIKDNASTKKFLASIGVDEDFIKLTLKSQYYTELIKKEVEDKFKEQYSISDKEFKNSRINVSAKHILLETFEKAEETRKELLDGADFSELASKRSLDKSTSIKGGDLGLFTYEELDKTISKVAFSIDLNKPSEPIKTEYGFHILLVYQVELVSDLMQSSSVTDKQIESYKDVLYKRALSDKIDEKKQDIISKSRIEYIKEDDR